ncbi:YjjG family noncanonical pyrimidine nucleotidase [Sphingobacterium sp. SYP-B4668]|uniref:YjjG family noncanonical pyrimidine nucleotidase n=1 Tax=Sphingobacterium sp. SYP-B4668 TaxID=2996035 RepID=UPI0022DD8605|nr:YjjG family noncanonical pyrimidine nucleotidase [Sphingobacterium sp. SYP-B4668]
MFQHKKDIFFDLDHTIWDFDKNAAETLHELFFKYQFDKLFNHQTADLFISTYTTNNHRLWNLYHHGKIDKPTLRQARFGDTFSQLGVDPLLFPSDFEEEYLIMCPQKTNLFPNAHETLSYLKERYNLHLISNGFKEACEVKLMKSNLEQYFEHIFISELVGVNKPDPKIFQHALRATGGVSALSIMVGDSIDADVRGAQNVGIDAIFFNPHQSAIPIDVKHSITDLGELRQVF